MSDKDLRDGQETVNPQDASRSASEPFRLEEPAASMREVRSGRSSRTPPKKARGILRFFIVFFIALASVATLFAALAITGHIMGSTRVIGPLIAEIPPEKGMTKERLEAKTLAIEKKMAALRPKGIYVVVDTAANHLMVRDGDKLLRDAIVSCGSGNILPNPKGGKDWVFDTPRGEFKIQSKITNPVWVKPDWAFIEEGKPIPPKNSEERYDQNVMGDYALGIGNGFFLHGTLYTRMLGRNVTHGCVRIADDDLKFVYDNMPMGAKVYLF